MIMEIIASIKDRDMDYFVWVMFSFLRKFINGPVGLNPIIFL